MTAPNGQSSILIGSAHVGVEGLLEPDTSVFANAKRYVVEHASNPQPGDAGPASGNGRAAWAKTLTDAEINVYLQRTRCAHIADAVALSFLARPSDQVANQYAYTICDGDAVPPPRDVVLLMEKPPALRTDTLEDDAQVEGRRRTVPDDVAETGFRWALQHDPKTVLDGVRDAMNRGDYESVREQFDISVGSADGAVAMNHIMVDERNAAWMPRLRHYLDEGQAVILVGAMHLPGPGGLISRLRSAGYTVTTIMLPTQASAG
ncbi:TraB/GumN family protein [Paraburkholderia sediminicola]|uniref:TraB/GumN family protein n=1 Tax=Paraburkholderia sediminicola TaxID=458836 RepID=UPI0038B881EE